MYSKKASIAINKFWVQLQNRPLVLDTITTTGWSSLSKAVGFLVPLFIAAWFGVTRETDAFFYTYGLILFLSGFFAPALESVIVPHIAEARVKNEDVGRFVGEVLGTSGFVSLVLLVVFLLIVKPILSVITHFDSQTLKLVYHLLIETAPLIILLVWTSVLAGTLNAYKKFAFPAVSPAFRALFNLSIIFFFKDTFGVHAIVLGYVVGEVVRLCILLGVIKQLNLFKLHLSFKVRPKLREFFQNAFYQTIGMVMISLNPIVDKTMASWLEKGSVSVLHYAERLYMIPVTFLTTGLMVTILSHWSSRYYESGHLRLSEDVKKAVIWVGLISLPIMLLLIFAHQPIVKLAFGRGAFAHERLSEVGWVWVCYLLGFVLYMMAQVFVRAHLSLKNTRLLMQCAFYLVILNILLNYILMSFFKVAGIALATSLSHVFLILYLGCLFYKKIQKEGPRL